MRFGEDVEIPLGSIRVYNGARHRVDNGTAYHPHGKGEAVTENVPGDLAAGGYVVTWRIISPTRALSVKTGQPQRISTTARFTPAG